MIVHERIQSLLLQGLYFVTGKFFRSGSHVDVVNFSCVQDQLLNTREPVAADLTLFLAHVHSVHVSVKSITL